MRGDYFTEPACGLGLELLPSRRTIKHKHKHMLPHTSEQRPKRICSARQLVLRFVFLPGGRARTFDIGSLARSKTTLVKFKIKTLNIFSECHKPAGCEIRPQQATGSIFTVFGRSQLAIVPSTCQGEQGGYFRILRCQLFLSCAAELTKHWIVHALIRSAGSD